MSRSAKLVDRIRDQLADRDLIRNISVIAHVDHGKSTLTDSLVSRCGLIAQAKAGEAHFMSTREDEQKRTITIKSTSVSMSFDVPTAVKTAPEPGAWTKEKAEAAKKAKEERLAALAAKGSKDSSTLLAAAKESKGESKAPQSAAAAAASSPSSLAAAMSLDGRDVGPSETKQTATTTTAGAAAAAATAEENTTTVATSETKTTTAAADSEVKGDAKTTEADATAETKSGRVRYQDKTYLVNLIDSPGHVDFSSEVTAALRVTDGALVLVDCIEGVCVQTETVLRQAITERIKPVLFLNKLDRVFAEQREDHEATYQSLARTIESVNVIVATHHDALLGDCTVWPQAGTVGFGSGLQGWGFTLTNFAEVYAERFNLPVKKMMKKLWGDNFWDPKAKKWTTSAVTDSGKKLERGFCMLVLKPLATLFKAIREDDKETYQKLVKNMNLKLTKQVQEAKGKELLKGIMQTWLPAADALLEMIVHHLPSPMEAQKYRVENLYSGPLDDEAAQAIRACDPNGPLMLYVSKMVPTVDKKRFFAFGRVFSGTVKAGQQVRIQLPGYVPDKKEELVCAAVQGVVLMMGPTVEPVSAVPCGNLVGLVGVDAHILKTATLTTSPRAHTFVGMKFSVAPVVRVAVSVVNPAHLAKLHIGLKRLVKADGVVQTYVSPSGENIVAGCGELHLEICLKDLQDDFMKDCPLKFSQPVVSYCETVTAASSMTCIAKTANKLNRLYMTAEPLDAKLVKAIDDGEISLDLKDDLRRAQVRRLVEDFDWDATDAKKIWTFGCPPDGFCNVLVDQTKGVNYVQNIRDSIVSSFLSASQQGVFADEPMRGIRFNLVDAKVHADSNHRGDGQIIPAAKRAMWACQVKAEPRLLEPMYLCTVNVPQQAVAGVYNTLRLRRATISEGGDQGAGTKNSSVKIEAFLPVAESFGFTELLRKNTSGQAFPQLSFSHWQVLKGDLLDEESMGHKVLMDIRKRKGLKLELPSFQDLHDNL